MVALDIDVAGAVAPGPNIAVYFAPNSTRGTIGAITIAIHDATNTPSVISISWGGAELVRWSAGSMDLVTKAFQEAAMMGVTILASTGDEGSNGGVSADTLAHIEYPASDPWVTGWHEALSAGVVAIPITRCWRSRFCRRALTGQCSPSRPRPGYAVRAPASDCSRKRSYSSLGTGTAFRSPRSLIRTR